MLNSNFIVIGSCLCSYTAAAETCLSFKSAIVIKQHEISERAAAAAVAADCCV